MGESLRSLEFVYMLFNLGQLSLPGQTGFFHGGDCGRQSRWLSCKEG